jgi:hypothetical protein
LKLPLWSPRADTDFLGYLRDLYRSLKWLLVYKYVLSLVMQLTYGWGAISDLEGVARVYSYLSYLVSRHLSYYLLLVHQISKDKVNSPPSKATYSRHLHLADLHQILGHVCPRTSTSLTQSLNYICPHHNTSGTRCGCIWGAREVVATVDSHVL